MKRIISYLLLFIILLLTFDGCQSEEYTVRNFELNTQSTLATFEQIMFGDSTRISALKSDETIERFKMVHFSDPHLSDWTADNHYSNPVNLIEAVELANLPDMRINAMVATGDIIANIEKTTALDASLYISSFVSFFYAGNQVPSFLCTGNHDANMLTDNTGYYLSKRDLNQLLFAKTNYPLHRPAGENYFYADLPNPMGGTIRIISLDNTDQEAFDYKSLNRSCITQQQVDWLIQTALQENMTDRHSVIILNHHPLQPFSRDLSTYMCSGTHLYGARLIPDIVNAFIRRKTWEQTYKTDSPPYRTITVKADFTQGMGEFICYMGGHAHTPACFEVECNDPSPARQIMLLANTLSPDLQNNTYCYIYRKKDDLSSNSFSLYAIDTQEKKIYITYFGAKSQSSPTIETVSYR
ncbi:MAG: metallophosphoesterase family protein [Parabacteroides sp.]